MALQFAPPPTFGQPQNLVPDIKVQPVARQSVPTRQLSQRDRQQEKDETKDYLLGLILGQAAPVIGDLAFKGASKIPGISGLLEDTVPEVMAPTRQSLSARAAAQGLDPIQTKALIDATMQQEAIRSSARPERQVPTKFGKAVQGIGGLLPAMAVKTPGGAKAFGQTYSSGLEAKAASQLSLAEAEQKIALERQKAIDAGRSSYVDAAKPVTYYGIDPRTGKQVSRNAVDVRGDRFVISQGTDYDRNIAGDIVPKGERYLNQILTADTNTENRAKEQQIPLYSPKTGELAMGYTQTVQEGSRAVNKLFVMRPGGPSEEVTGDNLWFPMSAEQTAKELKDAAKESKSEVTDLWADYADAQKSVLGTLQLVQSYQQLAAKNPTAMTTVAGMQAFITEAEANLNTVKQIFDNDMIEKTFRSKNSDGELIYNAEQLKNTLALKRAADAYYEDPNNPDKQAVFLGEFEKFRGNVNNTYASEGFSLPDDFSSSNRDVASARARLLGTQLQLAYRAAATEGQTGRTLSDKDLANFLKIVGYGSSQDLSVIDDQLNQFGAKIIEQFDSSTNTQIFKMREREEELERYLRTVVEIDQNTIEAAKLAQNELARQEVLDELSRASTNVANQFFRYIEQEDGTYKLAIPTFTENFGQTDLITAVLGNIKNYKENRAGSSGSSPTPTGTGAARSPVFQPRVGI